MKRSAVTLFGPPDSDPGNATAAVVIMEQARDDPHAARLHVTGTTVCGNQEPLPRNVRRRTARVAQVASTINMPRTGPVEVPWPASAFALPWPHSKGVMRLLVSAAQNNPAALRAAFRLYMSPRTTTPLRHTVVATLLQAKTSYKKDGGLTICGISRESPGLNFVIRTARQHNAVLSLPHSLVVPDTTAFYDGFIRCIMQIAIDRIAARYAGTGPKWAPAPITATYTQSTTALDLATKIGLLDLTPDRQKQMVVMLGPRSRFRGLPSSMQSCYSELRRYGHNCMACPLKFEDRQRVCDAEYADKPADVWARQAACDGTLSVDSLAATVPPCVAQFNAIRDFTFRRRLDVANIIKIVTAPVC